MNKIKIKNILIWNALDGEYALSKRTKYPRARIVCAEYHPHYIKHLKNLGFEVCQCLLIKDKDGKNGRIVLPREYDNMKFDLITGNPPYQEPGIRKGGSSKTLWDKFVAASFDYLEDGGYLSFITPPNWRKPYSDLWETFTSRQIEYVEMHHKQNGRETGDKVFGVATAFDVYVIHNIPYSHPTKVEGIEGEQAEFDLRKMPWLPSGKFDLIKKFMAKTREDRLDIIYSRSEYGSDKKFMAKTREDRLDIIFSHAAYETRKDHMSEKRTTSFKYPVVYTINFKKGPVFMYSSKNDRGHFGESKVICTMGGQILHAINDYDGKYGMSQFCFGIKVSSKKEAELLTKAMNGKTMQDFIRYTKFGKETTWQMFDFFKKDFYKIALEMDKKNENKRKN